MHDLVPFTTQVALTAESLEAADAAERDAKLQAVQDSTLRTQVALLAALTHEAAARVEDMSTRELLKLYEATGSMVASQRGWGKGGGGGGVAGGIGALAAALSALTARDGSELAVTVTSTPRGSGAAQIKDVIDIG